MAYPEEFRDLENEHLAHIIRDTFVLPEPKWVIVYDEDPSLMRVLAKPEHGFEGWMLYTSEDENLEIDDRAHYWEVGINDSFFGHNRCNLFLWMGYDPSLQPQVLNNPAKLVKAIYDLMAEGGCVLLTGVSTALLDMAGKFYRDSEIEDRLSRFSYFHDEDFGVLRK